MMNTRLLITLMTLVLITSCVPGKVNISISSAAECIQPIYNSFPITPQDSTNITPREIPPQGSWKIQDALPFSQDGFSYLGVRPKQYELWFKDSNSQKIYRYFINEGEWKTYQTLDWTMGVPDNLYITHDGTVWSAGIKFESAISTDKTRPLLSRFNDSMDRFEPVKDAAGFLQVPNVRLVSNIAEDPEGLLWFFVEDDRQILISFDVSTGQIEQHYSMETGGNTLLTIDSDGSIWFIDRFVDQIVQYDPDPLEVTRIDYENTDKIDPGGYPLDIGSEHYLYIDHSQRLWLADRAWLDFSQNKDPTWTRIPESPVFVGKSGVPGEGYDLLSTYSMYQSSNGWYWFTGGTGIVRLDLQEKTWCLMTTGISEVVEDSDHNLWIAVFGHLYKYSLEP